ncbi:phage tail tape measure protein [Aurantiacibacter luteus]|uniref:phage tail tape measure protein n=1 Tax=Aurantiacibacter luteus TaxID=1581420 RepID=UPI00069A209D|nr:phage tail tape measure protein [Aurantiacibacter luteus]
MALGDVLERLAVELLFDDSQFITGSTNAQRKLGALRTAMTDLGESWMRAGRNMTLGVTAPLTAFGLLSARAASDAKELQSAFDTTFGSLAPMMNRWAQQTGDAMGRATQDMQEMANTFGIFFNQAAPTRAAAAEMSQAFSVLAQDLASFYNVDPGEALAKLRSGLSGESEPLRDFGVFLTEAGVRAKGLEMGLGGLSGELSEQEKILARYQLILEATGNAQGDVARTSGSTANQARAFGAAMDELQVAIGTRLLPVLTPLIEGATRLVNAFTILPQGVQTAIVVVGGLAAAIGPLMLIMGTLAATVLPLFLTKFGLIGTAISFVINPLGTIITLFGQFALRLASLSILQSIGAALLRFAGPIGLIVSAGLLIRDNWERIVPIFERVKQVFHESIGPPLQRLIATLTEKFEALWNGPLGEGIRAVMGVIGQFAQAIWDHLGDRLVGVIAAMGEIVSGVFRQIGLAIDLVNALLNGDWASAWGFAQGMVANATATIGRAIDLLTGGALTAVRQLVAGVREWLVGRLNAVWANVTDKIDTVKNAFFNLYDAVVGHSYVPDMVDGIAAHMGRLDAVMVAPARAATGAVSQAMQDMARETQSLLDRLFPEVRRLLDYRRDLATIEGSGLNDAEKREARFRLGREGFAGAGAVDVGAGVIAPILPTLEELGRAVGETGQDVGEATTTMARSFKDMADQALGSLRGLIDGIKGGDFLGILEGVLGIGLQIAGIVTGKSQFAGSIPRFANGTNFAPGGLSLVGERGPELVNLPRGSQVIPNHELRGGGSQNVNVTVGIDPRNGNVTAFVDGRVAASAPGIMQGASQVTQRNMGRRQTRRVG